MSGGDASKSSRPPEQIAIGLIQDAEAYRVAALRVHPKREPFSAQGVNHTYADARSLIDAFTGLPNRTDLNIGRGAHLMHLEVQRGVL